MSKLRKVVDYVKQGAAATPVYAGAVAAGAANSGNVNTSPLREGQVFSENSMGRKMLDAYQNNVPEAARFALGMTPLGAVPDYFEALDRGDTAGAVMSAAQLIPGVGVGKAAYQAVKAARGLRRAQAPIAAGADLSALYALGQGLGG